MRQNTRKAINVLKKPKDSSDSSRRKEGAQPQGETTLFSIKQLNKVIKRSVDRFLSIQNAEGYWVFDLEADTTIPSEYVLLQRFLGIQMAPDLKNRLSNYIRGRQLDNGGWPLFYDGDEDLSCTVKAYFALKILGDRIDAPHMTRARNLILSRGGASRVNVFTRITMALFGQIPWRTAPAMPVEIMLLPRWFFFHLHKISYWSRTVIVPLLILYARQPVCSLSSEESIPELFLEPTNKLRNVDRYQSGDLARSLLILLDRALKVVQPFMPKRPARKAVKIAERWTLKRMGEGGLGAIFPAMANAVMALKELGYPSDHPDFVRGLKSIEDLLVTHGEETFCQPCVSPIWDTCLSLSALREAGIPADHEAVKDSVEWLFKKLITSRGDWAYRASDLEPAGWAFQFENTYYPDVDDTPMVLMALLRAGAMDRVEYRNKMEKAVNWLVGMQSSDGGWGSFDIDNNYLYLNKIPFADHGALLDPSTSDLTGRCLELLSMLGYGLEFPPVSKALEFLKKEQEECGAWFGRWGVNYIYGTWSVLKGLKQVGEDMSQPYIRKAVAWLKSCQNPDNGWGESCNSYAGVSFAGKGKSTVSQTAWALLGLMAAGEVKSSAVQRGIYYLLNAQKRQGDWEEKLYTGTGFPMVFYLRYHGYCQYFSLWALGEYRRLRTGDTTCQDKVALREPAPFCLTALKKKG